MENGDWFYGHGDVHPIYQEMGFVWAIGSGFARRWVPYTGRWASGLHGDWFYGLEDRFLGLEDRLLFCKEIGFVDIEMGSRFAKRWVTFAKRLALCLPGDGFYGHGDEFY